MRAVNRLDSNDAKFLDRVADKAVQMALEGDVMAMKEIGDRLDGKPVQGMTLDADLTGLKVTIEGGLPQVIDAKPVEVSYDAGSSADVQDSNDSASEADEAS
jgi:hypothetical protein